MQSLLVTKIPESPRLTRGGEVGEGGNLCGIRLVLHVRQADDDQGKEQPEEHEDIDEREGGRSRGCWSGVPRRGPEHVGARTSVYATSPFVCDYNLELYLCCQF